MRRRSFITGLLAASFWHPATPAAAGAIPIPHADLSRLWARAKQADDARQLLAMAPPSWGPLPWIFEGPVRFHDPEREETVRLRISRIYDGGSETYRALCADYEVLQAPSRVVVRKGAHCIPKGPR